MQGREPRYTSKGCGNDFCQENVVRELIAFTEFNRSMTAVNADGKKLPTRAFGWAAEGILKVTESLVDDKLVSWPILEMLQSAITEVVALAPGQANPVVVKMADEGAAYLARIENVLGRSGTVATRTAAFGD